MSRNLTSSEFLRQLDLGPYAWPGGYPRYFIASDGDALSFYTAQANRERIVDAIDTRDNSWDWRVVAVDINWEDEDLVCAHTNERIECAYPKEQGATT